VPLPASLAGSFFGGGAVGGGIAAGGAGIGAKIATVLAAGVVATGVGREAVQAVQASNGPSSAGKPAAVVDNPAFSPVSAITNGRTDASPIAAQLKRKEARKAGRPGRRFSSASKSLRRIAAGRPQRAGAPSSGGRGGAGSNAPLPQVIPVRQPPVQIPPVQIPPVQIPPVQTPPVQIPPVVQIPPIQIEIPPIQLPPPPPLP
jgi:hypothetical protein